MKSISFVFPIYNEEKNIKKVIKSALLLATKFKIPYEIILVNDGSSDQTGKILEQFQSLTPQKIKVITHKTNLGYGKTLRDGFRIARYEWIFFTDADNQFQLNDLIEFKKYTRDYDFITGYRIKRNDNYMRIINATVFNLAVRHLFKIKVKDVDCAFKLIKKSFIKNITLEANGALINTELLFYAQLKKVKVKELAVNHYAREYGKPTGANLNVIFNAGIEFIKFYSRINTQKI